MLLLTQYDRVIFFFLTSNHSRLCHFFPLCAFSSFYYFKFTFRYQIILILLLFLSSYFIVCLIMLSSHRLFLSQPLHFQSAQTIMPKWKLKGIQLRCIYIDNTWSLYFISNGINDCVFFVCEFCLMLHQIPLKMRFIIDCTSRTLCSSSEIAYYLFGVCFLQIHQVRLRLNSQIYSQRWVNYCAVYEMWIYEWIWT